MFADAIREVRQHPGRVVATLIAIAISVGFMAATSVFLETEKAGIGKQLNAQYSGADVVVQRQTDQEPDTQVLKKLTDTPEVAAAEASLMGFAALEKGDKVIYLQLYGLPGEQFRWSKVTDGAWPTGKDQIALPADVAKKLGVTVGQNVGMGDLKLTVSGITNDPPSRLIQNGYMSREAVAAQSAIEPGQEPMSGTFLVKAKSGVTPDQLDAALNPLTSGDKYKVETTKQAMDEQIKGLTSGVDALKYALMVFAGIALLVGMIIIANTFTILIAQRRRQIGLLRAVGASTEQVRRKFIGEALVLGLLGSLLGVALGFGIAAIGSALTGSLYWGLAFPVRDLAIEIGIGILITFLAAIVPIWKTSRVLPLEALRPVLSADSQKRVSKVRAIICTTLLVAGAVLAVLSLTYKVGENGSMMPVALAMGSAFLITFAVLGGAPLYVALLIKAWGKLIGLTGPTSRLATMNAARNPQRAASTAVALMLAIGLIITLQVGAATVRQTALSQIEEDYPIDLVVGMYSMGGPGEAGHMPPEVISKVEGLSNVKSKAILQGGSTTEGQIVVAITPEARVVAPMLPATIADDTALVSPNWAKDTKTTTVTGVDGKQVVLKLQGNAAAAETMLVNEATMKKLVKSPGPTQYWIDLVNRDDFASTQKQLSTLQQQGLPVMIGGGAFQAFLITSVLNIILAVITALLGVAVAIALVGVANTLGLSVIERTRESALLRALGMPRVKLRLMLLIEAITLALVGVVVGVVAGSFFAWLGVSSVFKSANIQREATFAIDWGNTLGLVGISVAAAALASILPGRKAAMATPTEALAVD